MCLSLCHFVSALTLCVIHRWPYSPASRTELCSSGIEIPFLGHACHLGTEQFLSPEVAEHTKQSHFGTVLELCPPPNKHSEMSAAPKRNGQLPVRAVLCVAGGLSESHSPPASSAVSLVGSSFKSVLRVVFQPGAVASLFLVCLYQEPVVPPHGTGKCCVNKHIDCLLMAKGHRQGNRSGGRELVGAGVIGKMWQCGLEGDSGPWNCMFEVLPNDSRCVLKAEQSSGCKRCHEQEGHDLVGTQRPPE